jgi:hypothetical protein
MRLYRCYEELTQWEVAVAKYFPELKMPTDREEGVMDRLDKGVLDYLVGRGVFGDLQNRVDAGDIQLLVPCLQMTLPAMETAGPQLLTVIKATGALANKIGVEEAGRRHFYAEDGAGRPVDIVFFRAEELMKTIANAHPQEAGEQIANLLLGSDQTLCVLAAIHASTERLSYDTLLDALQRAFLSGNDLIRLAASVALPEIYNAESPTALPPRRDVQTALENVKGAAGFESEFFPALAQRVRNDVYYSFKVKGNGPLFQDTLITKLALHYRLL